MAAVTSFSVYSFLLLLCTSFLSLFPVDGLLGRGFGDHIEWKTYSEGLKEAQSSRKPVMLIIHKSWCGACRGTRGSLSSKLPVAFILKPKESLLVCGRIVSTTGKFIINVKNMPSLQTALTDEMALKPKFAESKEIEELSKKFVMINVEDNEEPQDTKFQIDGAYIPRIFMLDSAGRVQKDIYNKKGNPSYKYYYGSTPGIVESMKETLEKLIDGVRIGDEL